MDVKMTPRQLIPVSILVSGSLIISEYLLLHGLHIVHAASIFEDKKEYSDEEAVDDLPVKEAASVPQDCREYYGNKKHKCLRLLSSRIRLSSRNMLPWDIKVPCLAKKFINFEIFNGFLDALEAVVSPCKSQGLPEVAYQQNATFNSTVHKKEYNHPKEWPCFRNSLNAREFYVELNKLYKLLNPCAPYAPKLDLASKDPSKLKDDENVGVWVSALWWFWWFVLRKEVVFYLAQRNQGDLEASPYEDHLIFENAFNPRKQTKILIEEYVISNGQSMNQLFKEAYFMNATTKASGKVNEDDDYPNVIIVQWSNLDYKLLYPIKRMRIVMVAREIVALVKRLVQEYGITCGSIHLIGHSLGAHIAGIAGNLLSEEENDFCELQTGSLMDRKKQFGRITGLDPAGPLFMGTADKWRLGRYSAEFVDVIHTNDYLLGDAAERGHVDFHVNSGHPFQPGCALKDILCSHYRAILYYRESIGRPNAFKARQCSSMIDFQFGNCDKNQTAIMGEKSPKNLRGSYYLNTASHYPFGLGYGGI